MFKNYLELSEIELQKLIEFTKKIKGEEVSFEVLDRQFRSEEYDFGRGIIISIKAGDIIGKASIILRECSKKGIVYVIHLEVSELVDDKVLAVDEIIDEAKTIAKKYGAKKIFLGTKDDKLIEVLGSLNFKKVYSAVRMILDNREVKDISLNLRILSEDNKKDYFEVYNDAFKKVTNGATVTESDVDQYLKNQDENNCYYLAEVDGKNIGFIQFNIENGIGEFDLGLISDFRGRGYGKRLLETAINFLNSKEVKQITLIVITSNTIAYEMYKKRGFKGENLISDWFISS